MLNQISQALFKITKDNLQEFSEKGQIIISSCQLGVVLSHAFGGHV